MTYQQQGRGCGHVTVLNFAVCHDAARRAGWSATAELLVSTGRLKFHIGLPREI